MDLVQMLKRIYLKNLSTSLESVPKLQLQWFLRPWNNFKMLYHKAMLRF